MESIFDVFSFACSDVCGKKYYSTRNGIAFTLSTSGYWMLLAIPNFLCILFFPCTKITTKLVQNIIFVQIYDFFVIVFI